MRKWWYGGAVVAGGVLLLGAAAPAQADLLPGAGTAHQQADEQLAQLLGQSNGINVENPLRYSTMGTTPVGASPVLQFKSGQNSPDLNPVLPGESAEQRPELPAADVVSPPRRLSDGLPVQNLNVQQLPLRNLPLVGLLGGLLPNGGSPGLLRREPAARAEAVDGGMPLLGGLGGLLPVNGLPKAADEPDTSGLPAGGIAIVPAADKPPTFGQPTADKPKTPQPAATPDDPRLHEEPIDGESAAPRRAFSADGRPVAGIDEQYE